MKVRTLLIWVVSVFLVFGLAACSGGTSVKPNNSAPPQDAKPQDAGKEPAKDSGEKVGIRFTWWGDTKRHEKYNAIADLFEKSHPNVKVAREFGSWNDYWDKLATQTAGGNAPDVVGMHATYVSDYARRGALIDLGPYIQQNVIKLNDFPQPVQEAGKVGGKTLMVAQGVTMTGYVYNAGLLAKLGVKEPDFNWTWDDFAAKAAEVKKAMNSNGSWGSGDMSSDITSVEMFARQRGKDLFNEGGKLGVDKKDMTDWFAIWDKLRKAKVIPDAETGAQYANVSLEQSLFVKGKIAFTAIPYNQIPNYQTYIKDGDVKALRRPTDPSGKNGEFLEGSYLAVTINSKHPKEAAEFINFFVNNEEAVKIFKTEQGALGSTKGNDLIKPLLDPAQQRGIEAIQQTLPLAGQLPLPPAGQGEVGQALKDAAEAIGFGKLTAEQGAAQFVDKATGILSK